MKNAILTLSDEQRHYLTERATFFTYCKVIKEGCVVFDLGANHGAHTTILSELVGPSGRVHAFEPNPALTPALKKIHSNVTVHEVAVGNKSVLGVLRVPKGLDGWASLDDRTALLPAHEFDEYSVPIRVIDEIDEIRHTHPIFIKIDVEGYELQALLGMKNILAERRAIVVFEKPTEEIIDFFETCDYRVFDFFGDDSSPPYEGLFNAVAIPNGYPQYERLFLSDKDLAFLMIEYLTVSKML